MSASNAKIKKLLTLISKEEPIEQKLFKLVALIGVFASFVNGILYLTLPDHIITSVFCFLAGFFSLGLIYYVQKSGKFLLAYLISVFGIFIGLFIVLFFFQGANSGYMLMMGMVFTCMLLHGRVLAIVAPIQLLSYLAVFAYTYYHPEHIRYITTPEKNFLSLIIGCLGCGIIICASLRVYIEQYKKANKIAEEATKEAIQASEAKDRFLANMSHEIRTPLTTILGMNDIIAQHSTSASVNEWTNDIRSSGRELLDLIDNILDFSRMGAGKEKVHEAIYPTQSLIHKWEYTGESLATKKGLAFKMNVDRDLPEFMYGDESKINRIVINLISNAVKYTDFGIIRLTVSTKPLYDRNIALTVSVKDTGHGISAEHLETIFDSFERIDSSQNRGIKGTGLGLAISKELATLMGGNLACKSEYEKGSEFVLSLSQEVKSEADYTSDSANSIIFSTAYEAPNAHVLVVDDSENNRNIVSLLLKKTRIRLDMAVNGLEALSRYKANHYDAVLMDYRMADMNGIETMERIRFLDNDENIHTPVIVMTADVVGDIREHLLAAGFDAYIAKPFSESALTGVLYKYLPKELIQEVDASAAKITQDAFTEDADYNSLTCGKRILLVDDSKDIHVIAGAILRDAQYEVLDAYSGEECVEMLSKISEDPDSTLPSMILLDINMRDTSGYDTFVQIHKLKGCEYIPIIFMTSETSVETEVTCMELGAADFITKPFVRDIMLARIHSHIVTWDKLRHDIASFEDNSGFDSKKLADMEKQLTPTEFLIAKLVSEGYSNRDIAEKSNYSYAYVKKVVSIIFEKLGISKRNELRELFK